MKIKLIIIAVIAIVTVLASAILPGWIPVLDVDAVGVDAISQILNSLQ